MENDWRNWCRLCAKEDIVLNSVNVFSTAASDDRQSMLDSWTGELSLSATIGKFFWVNISRDDDMPKVICGKCFALLSKLVQFSKRIMKVQKAYCLLQSKVFDKSNFHEVRMKCGLVVEDQESVSECSTTVLEDEVEMCCLDENHKIDDFSDLQEEDTEIENPLEPKDSLKTKSKVIADLKEVDPVEKCNIDDNDGKDWLTCTSCDKQFSCKWTLQRHEKNIHTKERPFICEQCGISFYSAGNLKQHMLTHTDYAPHECEICNKSFKHKSALRRHYETHDDDKHICSECGLRLSSRSTLSRHLLVHSNTKRHKCDHCGRKFNRFNALKTHLILHTGEKPYACDFCDRTFANSSNCRKHKKTTHPTELAALEAGGAKSSVPNVPKLDTLKTNSKSKNVSSNISKKRRRKKQKLTPVKYKHNK